jgi:hypothetical protein
MAENSSATLINLIERWRRDELALGLIVRLTHSGDIARIADPETAANSRRVDARTLSACS